MKRLVNFFFFSILVISSNDVFGQDIVNKAFKEGEKLKFVGAYYMSSLWTNLAEITMEVTKVTSGEKTVLRATGSAQTYTNWDSYFKIRDVYQSWIEPENCKPLIFKRDMDEGGYSKDEKYVFKRNSGVVNSEVKKKDGTIRKNAIPITPVTYDMVSALYYVRNLDFDKMPIDKVIPITVIIDEFLETVVVKYKGTETIPVGKYGNKKCYKLAVNIQNPKIVKYKETNNLWLTADANRVPVLIKAEIPVGSIQMQITEMNGLRN
jgi:hypothetical protein